MDGSEQIGVTDDDGGNGGHVRRRVTAWAARLSLLGLGWRHRVVRLRGRRVFTGGLAGMDAMIV